MDYICKENHNHHIRAVDAPQYRRDNPRQKWHDFCPHCGAETFVGNHEATIADDKKGEVE